MTALEARAAMTTHPGLDSGAATLEASPMGNTEQGRHLGSQRCKMCSLVKTLADFTWSKRMKRHVPSCKTCLNKLARDRRQAEKAEKQTKQVSRQVKGVILLEAYPCVVMQGSMLFYAVLTHCVLHAQQCGKRLRSIMKSFDNLHSYH